MARTARPWFRVDRHAWFVTLNGHRYRLGEHPDGYATPRCQRGRWNVPKPIDDQFHALRLALERPSQAPPQTTPDQPRPTTVAEVFKAFLDWCGTNRSPRTREWARRHLQSFVDALYARTEPIDPCTFPAEGIKPFHVSEWVEGHRRKRPGRRAWGPNHCRGAITAVQRAFNWAERMGHLTKSPVRHVEKPAPVRREQVLTRNEFATLLAHVKDGAFRDVLEFCWETGCRVQEVRVLAARHYRRDRGRLELPPAEAKGKKRWRLIYLSPRAAAIADRLAAEHPEGPLFRNTDGKAWEAEHFNNRFDRLKKKLGVKYALTAIRHSFATRLLESGVDHITVAMLLGHVDATMLSRVYQHVGEKSDFLRTELLRASGGGPAA